MNYNTKTDYRSIPDGQLAVTVMAELAWHREQDNLAKGQYWEGGKGCAGGCLLKNGEHSEYPLAFGIPIMLAGLQDRFFEGVTEERSKLWPEEFMAACMEIGGTREERLKRLEPVGWQLMHWVVADELPKSVIGEGKIYNDARKVIAQCADALLPLTQGKPLDKKAAKRAIADANAASYAVRAARAAVDAVADDTYEHMADKLLQLIGEA
ncbi:MAG: hypothetical protein ACRC1W_12875 [Shewanella sp.]